MGCDLSSIFPFAVENPGDRVLLRLSHPSLTFFFLLLSQSHFYTSCPTSGDIKKSPKKTTEIELI